jgi:hypothetical protein
MRKLFRWTLLFLVLSPLFAAEQHGQVTFAGLPLPGASVTVTQGDKSLAAITDQQGNYTFADVPDGAWTFKVEMLCFATVNQEMSVTAGLPIPPFEMKLLPLSDIQAQAGPATPPPPSTPSISLNPAPRRNGRNAKANAAPATPQAGFTRAGVNASNTPPASAPPPPSDAGTQSATELNQRAADGFLINGSSNNSASSPFALNQAFGNGRRGLRSLYNGSIGLIWDNSALDANSFSLTGQNTPKPYYDQLRLVGNIGGPLRIPHLIRNGPIFFVGYQWSRNHNASTSPNLVPTLAERKGDFSQTLNGFGQPVQIYDPSNGMPFMGNVIPPSRVSQQAQALLAFYPQPNSVSSRYNYQVPLLGLTGLNSLQSRLNKVVDNRNQLFGTFNFQSNGTDTPSIFGFTDNTSSLGINTSASWNHRYNQRLFATVSYQFSRLSTTITPWFASSINPARTNVSGNAGILGNEQSPLNWGPPGLSFTSTANMTDANPSAIHNQTGALSYNVFWNRSPHNVSFGGDYKRLEFNSFGQADPRGSFAFTGGATQQILNGVPVQGTGFDLADFVLGVPDAASIAYGNADKYFRSNSYDAFINDDWRVSPGLTLNVGVRWEYNSPITELYGRLVNLDVAGNFNAISPVLASSPAGSLTGIKYPSSLVDPDRHAFQPRLAFSWRPFAASSMIVRGGYGVYYDTSIYQTIATQMSQQPPLSKSFSVQNSLATPLTLAEGFNTVLPFISNTFGVDPNFRTGYAQNWQLSVQRDLPWGMQATVAYLGTKGTRGVQDFLPNTYPIGVTGPCSSCPTGFKYMTSNGNSTREAGQLQLRRRLRAGFTANLQYTWAKAIDDAALGGKQQGVPVIAQNWLDLSGERGLSSFDQRHLVNFSAQYTSGMGIGGGTLLDGWKGTLLKEWTISTQITAGTGLPLTPNYLNPVPGTGVTGPIRPDYTGASVTAAPSGLFLNPAAYTAPYGHWGDAGRDSITGPSQFSVNASLSRAFRLTDRFNMDVQVQATNALNHVTFPSWNTTINSTQFGLPITANAMRTVQTTVRVRF